LKNGHLPFDRLTALSFAEGLRCDKEFTPVKTGVQFDYKVL